MNSSLLIELVQCEYGKRGETECMFKDFKSGGFNIEETQLKNIQRINGLYTYYM